MFYDFSFTIPANTTKASPHEEAVKLCHGVIHRIEIGFPRGCAGLVHLQIREALHQHWPTNPQGSFRTDGYTIAFNDHLKFTRRPYKLTLSGWNLDDTYDHTLEVRIGILLQEALMPERPFTPIVRRITERLGL